MNESALPTPTELDLAAKPGLLERAARRALLARLEGLTAGELRLVEPGGERRFGPRGPEAPLRACVRVHDPAFYPSLLLGGSLGAAESYMRGEWSCDDLPVLVRLVLRDGALDERVGGRWARLAAPARRLQHRVRRNTRRGSRRNVAAHYDLGNRFFALFLDPTLTYSAGIFERPDASMEEASVAKYERLCRKLELRADDRVLEIGSGWGGFALHAATRYGCRVATTTISREQHALAQERVAAAGLADRVTVLHRDYRDLEGRYDKLVSIEMIEAVGHAYLDIYFRVCSERLCPDGRMALQAIVTTDERYEASRRSTDFIKHYIFPGGQLPSVRAICRAAARASDLRMTHLEDITPHYAETLRHWRSRFRDNREAIRALGYSEPFLRMWELYLCSCEAAFEERTIGDVQIVLDKTLPRPAPRPGVPQARDA